MIHVQSVQHGTCHRGRAVHCFILTDRGGKASTVEEEGLVLGSRVVGLSSKCCCYGGVTREWSRDGHCRRFLERKVAIYRSRYTRSLIGEESWCSESRTRCWRDGRRRVTFGPRRGFWRLGVRHVKVGV